MSRKIKELYSMNGDIYIILSSKEIAERFLRDAEDEGITFGDGVPPTKRHAGDVYRLYRNGTISYVGFVGHVRLGADKSIQKIDYAQYIGSDSAEGTEKANTDVPI